MYGNIIAICLLAMPVVALAAMACAWSPAEDDLWVRVWPTAWFPALWIAFWAPMFVLHDSLNYDVNPFVFWLPLLSWLGVSLCCKLGKIRKRGLAALLLLLAVAVVVSQEMPDGWAHAAQDHDNLTVLSELQSRIRRANSPLSGLSLRAGWIDSPALEGLWKPSGAIEHLGLREERIHSRVWHTWLTGLYRVTPRSAGVWYPGGKPAVAAFRLEWRPR